ncbi:MAG: enoyl-CoA hydratase/isomerase family protein [Dehalococcoidia bacterium]|nr:enoyl-CoA hydratase/isomerase family protein [Dehalococcoidia bacterium]
MAYEQIKAERRGHVGVITLSRPEKLNAWTDQMHRELVDQVEQWNADSDIGAMVLTGEGRAFCAGADLGGFKDRLETVDDAPAGGSATNFSTPWTTLLRQSKPVVAAINGYAMGVGLTMVLPCDVRLAAEGAQVSIRFVKVGLLPELGSTRLLPQIVGLGNATDMCLTGRMVGAEEALRMGLVIDVTPADQLLDASIAKAEELAGNPPSVVRFIKELLAKNPLDQDLDAVMEREQVRDRIARRLPEHAEAVSAFLEKRDPQFYR